MMALPDSLKAMVRRINSGAFQISGLPREIADPGTFDSRKAAEVWLLGKIDLLTGPRQRRIRSCMCCRSSFESEGPHNRLCDPCRKRGSAEGAAAAFSFGAVTGRRKSA